MREITTVKCKNCVSEIKIVIVIQLLSTCSAVYLNILLSTPSFTIGKSVTFFELAFSCILTFLLFQRQFCKLTSYINNSQNLRIPCATSQCQHDTNQIGKCNVQVKDDHSQNNGKNLLYISSNCHGQSTGLFVGGETDYVQKEGHDTVDQQCKAEGHGQSSAAEFSNLSHFTSNVGINHSLDKCQRRHTQQEIQRMQLETAHLNSVGHHCLDSSQDCTQHSQYKPQSSVVVFTKCSKCNTENNLMIDCSAFLLLSSLQMHESIHALRHYTYGQQGNVGHGGI